MKSSKLLEKSPEQIKKELAEIDPLTWAKKYRIIDGKPYRIDTRPYLAAVYDQFIYNEEKSKVVVAKGAQTGLSETAINISLWFIENCGDVMYTLPTNTDASDFSAGRYNPAIEESPHIDEFFTDTNNVGHKRAGNRNFYLRGSQSKSKLKSVPIDFLILDEIDEMVQDNISLALDRLDASCFKWELWISTPTYPEFGIHAEYLESDQRKWYVGCDNCGTEQVPDFFANILEPLQELTPDGEEIAPENAAILCKRCGAELDVMDGEWRVTNPEGKYVGFHISQLLSPTVSAAELVQDYLDAQGSASDMEDFYNSKLGLPYVAEGDKLEAVDVKQYRDSFETSSTDNVYRSMGIDVGSYLHYVISEPHITEKGNTIKRTVDIGKATKFRDLDRLMKNHNVKIAVIDCRPETREAKKLAKRVKKHTLVLLCEYKDDYKQIRKIEKSKRWLTVDRTISLDQSLGRFYQGTIILPQQVPEEYVKHLTSLVRVIEEKGTSGEQVARYKNSGPDHYGHANNYDEEGYRLLVRLNGGGWKGKIKTGTA